ncbi:MAG: aliphatic sulfonate ABC transporter substrate-binding protein [Veillonellales bacterium]
MKKFLLFGMAIMIILSALLVGGCAGKQESAVKTNVNNGQAKIVRIGTVPLPFYSHMWVAYKKGFLAEELNKAGFQLIWKPINLGPVVSESFAAGELDMGVMGDLPAFVGRSSGIQYTIVSASDIAKAHALLVNPKSGIRGIADLKDKKVATTKNTSGYELLSVFLEKEGMTFDDIHFVNMSMADLGQALIKGDIDAGVVWEPSVTRLESGMKLVVDGEICANYAVLLAGDEFLKDNPAAIEAVNKAYGRGYEYLKENPDECLKMLAIVFKISEAELKPMIEKYEPVPFNDKVLADLNDQEAFLSKAKIMKGAVDTKTFIHR